MTGIPHPLLGLILALLVGGVLGLLGGGGSILALPIFLYVFQVPTKPAIAMSLAVVGMSSFVGFLTHWRQGTVNLRVALPFGGFAMVGAFVTARVARHVPESVQLGLFAVFALTASILMLRDSFKAPAAPAEGTREGSSDGSNLSARKSSSEDSSEARFSAALAVQALGVGVLTALIGAGGGFVIVPALVLLAHVPIRTAVGSSLLIITMNSMSGFAGYIGQVPIQWNLVGAFTGVAAIGALAGTRASRRVPQARIKQGFAVMILVLGTYLALRKLNLVP
ncbi:MAG: sulfite exporter TauE/SafE family protein [Gemmatimonadota bacterium]